jgi:hypothetical protein
MTVKLKVDTSQFADLSKITQTEFDKIKQDAYAYFLSATPIKTGNARSKTKLTGNKIVGAYPYADRLDQGYSTQSPQGMTEPTVDYIEKTLIPQAIRRINSGK